MGFWSFTTQKGRAAGELLQTKGERLAKSCQGSHTRGKKQQLLLSAALGASQTLQGEARARGDRTCRVLHLMKAQGLGLKEPLRSQLGKEMGLTIP